jgi:transposase InsO family protein
MTRDAALSVARPHTSAAEAHPRLRCAAGGKTYYAPAHGIEPKRVMTDNAWSYTLNRSLRELLAERGIRHRRTKPHRPRTNGKVERFIQTLEREWASASPTRAQIIASMRCQTGSTTTTPVDRTAR